MGRKIQEKFQNCKVKTQKQLINQSLNTTVVFQGKLPDYITCDQIYAVSPLEQIGDEFYRRLIQQDGTEILVKLEIAQVKPSLVELENQNLVQVALNNFKAKQNK